MTFDGKAFGETLAGEVRGYVERRVEELLAIMAGLEMRVAAADTERNAAPAPVGEAQIRAWITDAVGTALAAIEPAPAPDLPAVPTIEQIVAAIPPVAPLAVDMEAVRRMVFEEVAAQVQELPPPEKGDPGEIDMDQLRAAVADSVAAQVALLPPPEKGDPGEVDMEAVRHLVETAVAALPPAQPGQSGVGLAGALIDRDGALVITLTDGKAVNLGRVVGKDGDHGKPGLGFDDFETDYDGERHLKLIFTREDLDYIHHLHLPVPVYRGVWTAREHERGDMVTWAGSLWHCDAETSAAKPGEGNADWTLAVKKGRDGKPAQP